MKVLWHSCSPTLGTGYGTQTALWTTYLQGQGHEVVISSYINSLESRGKQEPVRHHGTIPVLPPPVTGNIHGNLPGYAAEHNPDVIIVLADIWIMNFTGLDRWPVLAWTPVDCQPLGLLDTLIFKQQPVTPVAISEHGQRAFRAAGIPCYYVPHAIDTEVWKPDPMRMQLRAAFGIAPEEYAIGMNFNNVDAVRKATPEQWYAFAEFSRKHPEATVFAHTTISVPENPLNLQVLAHTLKITDRIRFADQKRVHTAGFTQKDMIRWYSAMDVVLNATYGEGFGLPAIEAQACGTPVILADNTTGPQLKGPGYLVKTEPFWNYTHNAWWGRPSVNSIQHALTQARQNRSPFKREACRHFAGSYDIREVGPMWLETLEQVASGKPLAVPA